MRGGGGGSLIEWEDFVFYIGFGHMRGGGGGTGVPGYLIFDFLGGVIFDI